MSNLIIPRTDASRMASMQALLVSLQRAPPEPPDEEASAEKAFPMVNLVPATMADELVALEPTFRSVHEEMAQATFLWKDAIKTASAATDQLSTCVKDVWAIMKRRLRRRDLSDEVVTRYQLPPLRQRRPGGGRREWVPVARNLLVQMAAAEDVGGPPFTDPGIADVQACLAEAEAALARLSELFEQRKRVQTHLAVHRETSDALYRRLASCVKAGLVGQTPSKRRELMRAMGFRFEDAETPEPEAPATTEADPVPESTVGRMPLIPTPAPAG